MIGAVAISPPEKAKAPLEFHMSDSVANATQAYLDRDKVAAPVIDAREQAIIRVHDIIDEVIEELEQNANYAGFITDVARNAAGEILFIRLIACDAIDGIVAPRIA